MVQLLGRGMIIAELQSRQSALTLLPRQSLSHPCSRWSASVLCAKEDSRMGSDEQDISPICDAGGETLAEPRVIEEIEVEDLAVDGICGVY